MSDRTPSEQEAANSAARWVVTNRVLREALPKALLLVVAFVFERADANAMLKEKVTQFNEQKLCKDSAEWKTLSNEYQRKAVERGEADAHLLLNVLRHWRWKAGKRTKAATTKLGKLLSLRDSAAKQPGTELSGDEYDKLMRTVPTLLAAVCKAATMQVDSTLCTNVKQLFDASVAAVRTPAWRTVFFERRRAALHRALAGRGAHAAADRDAFLDHHCAVFGDSGNDAAVARDFLVCQLLECSDDDDAALRGCFLGAVGAIDTIVMLRGSVRAQHTALEKVGIGFLFALRCSTTKAGFPFTLHFESVGERAISVALRVKLELQDKGERVAKLVVRDGDEVHRASSVDDVLRWAKGEFRGGGNKPYSRLVSWQKVYGESFGQGAGATAAMPLSTTTSLVDNFSDEERLARRAFLERLILEIADNDGEPAASFVGFRPAVDTMLLLEGHCAAAGGTDKVSGWLFAMRCSVSTPASPFTIHALCNGNHKSIRVSLQRIGGNWCLGMEDEQFDNQTFSSLCAVLEAFQTKYMGGENTSYLPDTVFAKVYGEGLKVSSD